jgi:hypothetical protein
MNRTRIFLLASLLTSLVFVTGQALAAIPNVEAVTFLVFVAGFLLGVWPGLVVGACGMGAHSLFNAMGAVALPILAAQVACYALIGVSGAVLGPRFATGRSRVLVVVLSGVCGAALTFAYQVLVNIVSYYSFASGMSLRVYLTGGIAFAVVQIGWNALLFAAAMPPTLRVLGKQRRDLAVSR